MGVCLSVAVNECEGRVGDEAMSDVVEDEGCASKTARGVKRPRRGSGGRADAQLEDGARARGAEDLVNSAHSALVAASCARAETGSAWK